MTVHSSHSGGDRGVRAAKAGSAGMQVCHQQHPVSITNREGGLQHSQEAGV